MKPIFSLTIFVSFFLLCFLFSVSFAEIPHLINYQGRLTDSQGTPITGTKSVTFRIYDTESGGSALWQETYSNLAPERSIFNVMLGGVTALNLAFDRPYWLSIQVGGDPEMTPRQRIASSGYAFTAENADNATKINGIQASSTPQANKILPLDANAKFPASTLGLKVYDSGWFQVVRDANYVKEHNLGTTKCIIQTFIAQNADGSGWCLPLQVYKNGELQTQMLFVEFTVSTITLRIGGQGGNSIVDFLDKNGDRVGHGGTSIQTAYCRIIILALEEKT